MGGGRGGDEEECREPLLNNGGAGASTKEEDWQVVSPTKKLLGRRVWEESKKLWVIVAPAIFSRVVTYSMNVITQAFAGHLGDLELAAISIANTVVVGFNFGLMIALSSYYHARILLPASTELAFDYCTSCHGP
uniref:Protein DETOXIFICATION n=1 Tax=Leersia perrieri TaxID=77586 RepID=A0A0D9VQI5_9ORYZ